MYLVLFSGTGCEDPSEAPVGVLAGVVPPAVVAPVPSAFPVGDTIPVEVFSGGVADTGEAGRCSPPQLISPGKKVKMSSVNIKFFGSNYIRDFV